MPQPCSEFPFVLSKAQNWPFGPTRPKTFPLFLIGTLTSYWVIVAICFTQWVFVDAKKWFFPGWWIVLQTGGLINLTLIANFLLLTVTLFVALGLGRQKFQDLGWRQNAILPGFMGGIAVFLVIQWIQVVVLWSHETPIIFDPKWTTQFTWAIGDWIGQFLGNCLFEETAFRGLLLPQTWLILEKLLSKRSKPVSRSVVLVGSLLISQGIFAGIHIPVNLSRGAPFLSLPLMLLAQFVSGLIFVWVYMRTGNLVFTIILHAFFNYPVPLLNNALPGGIIAGVGTLVGLIFWEVRLRMYR